MCLDFLGKLDLCYSRFITFLRLKTNLQNTKDVSTKTYNSLQEWKFFWEKGPKLKKTRWNCIVYKVNSFYANILLNLLTANILRCTRKNIFYLVSKSQHQFIYCPNQPIYRIGLLHRFEMIYRKERFCSIMR